MTTPAHPANLSGFAQFTSAAGRDRFVRTVLDPDPALKDRTYVSGGRPTIVFENLTAEERDRVIAALRGVGRWFDDVQFQSTE